MPRLLLGVLPVIVLNWLEIVPALSTPPPSVPAVLPVTVLLKRSKVRNTVVVDAAAVAVGRVAADVLSVMYGRLVVEAAAVSRRPRWAIPGRCRQRRRRPSCCR